MNLTPFDCEVRSEPPDPNPYTIGSPLRDRPEIHVTVRAITDTGRVQTWKFKAFTGEIVERDATPDDYENVKQVADQLTTVQLSVLLPRIEQGEEAAFRVGDRVVVTADGYSEPPGSFATVTEIHPECGNAMTVRWEHRHGTLSTPIWPDDVELAK